MIGSGAVLGLPGAAFAQPSSPHGQSTSQQIQPRGQGEQCDPDTLDQGFGCAVGQFPDTMRRWYEQGRAEWG
jgi:hypothetical protein